MRTFTEHVRQGVGRAQSLEQGAQFFAREVYGACSSQLVLARTYVAMPLYRLPARERAFATAIAKANAQLARLHDETPTLTLLGTSGVKPQWGDRSLSSGHVAIPLTDTRSVDAAPMVASLLQSLGVQLAWFDAPREVFVRKLVGGMNGIFYVRDAAQTRDSQGRLVIPAQDFVQQHGVKTVFGVGGSYLNGWLTTSIFFSRDLLDRSVADAFIPVGTAFKMATMQLVASGRIFAA